MDIKGFEKINDIDGVFAKTRPAVEEDMRFVTVFGDVDTVFETDPDMILNALWDAGVMNMGESRDETTRRPDLRPVGFVGTAVVLEDLSAQKEFFGRASDW